MAQVKAGKVVSDNKLIYGYEDLMSNVSLRKALNKGKTTRKELFLREFKLPDDRIITGAAFAEEKNVDIGDFRAQAINVRPVAVLIDQEGIVGLEAYKYYSRHPSWKVRAAVVNGLGNKKCKEAVAILADLLNDKCFSVSLAVVQALEKIKTKESKKLLSSLIKSFQKDDKAFAEENSVNCKRAISSITNKKKQYPQKKINKREIVFHTRQKKNIMLFVDVIYDKNYVIDRSIIPNSTCSVNPRVKIKLMKKTWQTKIARKNKLKFHRNLDTYNFFLNNLHQQKPEPCGGEIYWATTDQDDPKMMRPLLIVMPSDDTLAKDKFWGIPFTSNIASVLPRELVITVAEKPSKMQIDRKRIIDASSLVSKCGKVSSRCLKKVLNILNNKGSIPKAYERSLFFYQGKNATNGNEAAGRIDVAKRLI